MNILYILGNGFDLAQGLDTSYPSFLKYYLENNKDEDSESVRYLKEDIVAKKAEWSYMEERLGRWLDGSIPSKVAIEAHDSLVRELTTYMKREQERVEKDDKARLKLLQNIVNPETLLEKSDDTTILSQFISGVISNTSSHRVDFLTLNYTDTLERIIGFDKQLFHPNQNTVKYEIRKPVHLHGLIGEGLILGVNDETQVKDKQILNDQRVANRYIKPTTQRKVKKNGREEAAAQLIKNAHLICIYGTSFGRTDQRIWEMVWNRLNSGSARAILYHFDKRQFESYEEQQKNDYIVEQSEKFVWYGHVREDGTPAAVPSTVFGEYNSDIFNIGLKVKPTLNN